MQKQKLHYALCANLKDSITHRVYKLQFIGLIGGAGFQPAAAAGFEHLLIVCLVLNKLTLY